MGAYDVPCYGCAELAAEHALYPVLREVAVRARALPAAEAVVLVLAHAGEECGDLVDAALAVALVA
jgi:hypothetical protein